MNTATGAPPDPRAAARIETCVAEASRLDAVELAIGAWDECSARQLVPLPARPSLPVDSRYPDPYGEAALRESIAAGYSGPAGDVTPRQITVALGATGALAVAIATLLRPGEEILTVSPTYAITAEYAQRLGVAIKTVPAIPDQDGHPCGAIDWSRVRHAISPRTKAILLCDPDNPTGRVLTANDYREFATLSRGHRLWQIVDRTYETFPGTRQVVPTASMLHERMVVAGSVSKSLCAASLRVGWLASPARLAPSLARTCDIMFGGVPIQAQAIATLLPARQELVAATARRRCAELTAALQAAGLNSWPVQGGLFVCVPCEDFHAAWARLAGRGVVGVSASAFLPGKTPGFVRLCFARSEETITNAGRRLALSGEPPL